MIWKLTVTFYSDKDHAPIWIQVGIPEKLAHAIQGQKLDHLAARLEMEPGFSTIDIPLLKAGGDNIKL